MFTFLWPWAFALLPLPLLVRLFPARRQIAHPHFPALRVPFFNRLNILKTTAETNASAPFKILIALAWMLFIIALARPVVLSTDIRPITPTGRHIVIALDTSGSMRQLDLSPQNTSIPRFDVSKTVLTDFIRRRTGDAIGIILFGTESYTYTPLSLDTKTTLALLDEAAVGIAGDMTAIGDAILLGIQNLIHTPTDKRILILMSDGENTAGTIQINRVLTYARTAHVKIYTIGIGANSSADLDETTLQKISSTTGGRYFRARSANELADIYATLDRIEPIPQADLTLRPRVDIFHIPLFFSLCFFFWIYYRRAHT